jgi:iron complex outermembrane receptor protein
VYGTSALALLGSMYGPGFVASAADQAAVGQTADQSTESSQSLTEVVVTGVRKAMSDSIETKKKIDLVSDSVTTKDIGVLPDVTIAEELSRLPGVNVTRDRGNASQASVRGLGPRLVLGLVNGREVASSEPSQDLRWEIYPSEVLAGADVYKSQDASLISGGVAATIDIRTLNPLDVKDDTFSVRVGPTYNEEGSKLPHYNPVGYRGSVGWVSHFNDDFAIALAASAQQEKNGFPDFRTFGWNTPDNAGAGNTGDLNGDGKPDNTTWGLNTEVKEVTQTRYAFSASPAWRANDNLTIKGDALYSQYEIKENQFQAWYGNNITGNWADGNAGVYNAPGNSYQIVNGSVVAASLNNAFPNYESAIARYTEKHQLFVTGLNAAWNLGEWSGSGDLSYSDAWRHNRWMAIYLSDVYPPSLAFNVTDGQTPYGATPGLNPADPSLQSAGGFRSNSGSDVNGSGQSDGPEVTHDRLGALAVDFSRAFDSSFLSGVKFGGRLASREKTNHQNRFGLCAGSGSTVFTTPFNTGSQVCSTPQSTISLANAGLQSFNVPSFTAPPMVYGNFDSLLPLVYPNTAVPAGSELLLSHTKVLEHTGEGFVRLDFKSDVAGMPLTGGLGVRVAHVSTTSDGYTTIDGSTYTPVSISANYTDVLPSLNTVLHVTPETLLRFGASISVARPPLDALITGFSLNPTGSPPTGGGGNPQLRPYKSDNLDLSYEWYYHPESLIAVAVYYKYLKDMIGASSSLETIQGTPFIITSENNTPGGRLEGVEGTYQTRLYFLPGFLSDFGVYANAALVSSNIHEQAPASNPYMMVGLAHTTTEADLFYNKGGFESRVAWKHHSAFTVAPTWVGTTLKELAPEDILDASVSYTFNKNWSVRVQGHNLTNERARFSADNNPQDLANDGGYQVYGRSYLFDVAFKL